jgi:hydrogenase maturation protein HypF
MTYQINISGIVQGVGFRPMVYALATKKRISGTVSNSTEGVVIQFNADEKTAHQFYKAILNNLPSNSRVTHHLLTKIKSHLFNGFHIIESTTSSTTSVMLSPDFAMCASCREEIHDPTNRRYHYPFITCTQCGPRYSIIFSLPFDRSTTSMNEFEMCETCISEYSNVSDRRFYSQTNSCEDCGIKLKLHLATTLLESQKQIIPTAIQLLEAGKTVAVKGIGGYLLLCDATNENAISQLRKRKHRATKPFAVLYPNLSQLRSDVKLCKAEEAALQSVEAPIVIVALKTELTTNIQTQLIAPGLQSIGVMLPYAPLLELIASQFQKPLIATSANISNSPIVYQDDEAIQLLFSMADAVLVHNRAIVIPQDDSVVRFTDSGRRIVIRRARGMSPSCFGTSPTSENILAVGAQLKSTIALQHSRNTYLSQYIGNLESADTEKNYQTILNHLLTVTGAKPELILADLHPDYTATRLGQQYASISTIPFEQIQHHEAHLAAVLSENNLLEEDNPILGVVWDGTGLGSDLHHWGGEFFRWQENELSRVAHLSYFPLLLGDKMAREPRLSALALTPIHYVHLLEENFTQQEWKIYTTALQTESTKSSSMGRLFDAVAAWCGFCDKATYEGEAALLLEEAAKDFIQSQKAEYFHSYPIQCNSYVVDTPLLVVQVINDVRQGIDAREIAARFHCTLVQLIKNIAEQHQLKSIAFSGGVFQNALLVGLIEKYLSKEFQLYFHRQLSPNDECISFGQLAHWQMTSKKNLSSTYEFVSNIAPVVK